MSKEENVAEALKSYEMPGINSQRAAHLVSAASTIQQTIKAAVPAGRPLPRLVAVSKLKPSSDILALHESSLEMTHFGENYFQELQDKAKSLPRSINWHFIGGLQTNKCRPLAEGIPNLWAVESVDTVKKADQLEKGRASLFASDEGKDLPKANRLRIYVQVNTSGEAEKSGAEPGEDTLTLCKHVRDNCGHLRLQGLMTIGAIARSKSEMENEDFIALRNEKANVVKELGINDAELELSMGMSADYEEAIKQGSDQIRVGSQIFGARPPKKPSDR